MNRALTPLWPLLGATDSARVIRWVTGNISSLVLKEERNTKARVFQGKWFDLYQQRAFIDSNLRFDQQSDLWKSKRPRLKFEHLLSSVIVSVMLGEVQALLLVFQTRLPEVPLWTASTVLSGISSGASSHHHLLQTNPELVEVMTAGSPAAFEGFRPFTEEEFSFQAWKQRRAKPGAFFFPIWRNLSNQKTCVWWWLAELSEGTICGARQLSVSCRSTNTISTQAAPQNPLPATIPTSWQLKWSQRFVVQDPAPNSPGARCT